MKENIYRLYTSDIGYKTIDYNDTPLLDCLDSDIWDSLTLEKFQFVWNSEETEEEESDCPFLIGAIPIIKSNILMNIDFNTLQEIVDIINIKVSGNDFSILIAKDKIKGLLNKKKSDIDYFSDGRIMRVNRYVFNNHNDLPPLFRIEEYPLFTFANARMANILNKLDLKGLLLEECEVVKGWSFL